MKTLICSSCLAPATGQQWYNRDTGYGLCPKCATWLKDRETAETMRDCYGVEGIHYFLKPDPQQDRLDKERSTYTQEFDDFSDADPGL